MLDDEDIISLEEVETVINTTENEQTNEIEEAGDFSDEVDKVDIIQEEDTSSPIEETSGSTESTPSLSVKVIERDDKKSKVLAGQTLLF